MSNNENHIAIKICLIFPCQSVKSKRNVQIELVNMRLYLLNLVDTINSIDT